MFTTISSKSYQTSFHLELPKILVMVASLLLGGVGTASAAPIADFKTDISGAFYSKPVGSPGTFKATFSYNLGDSNGDGLPDNMQVKCISGLQNNGYDCGDGPPWGSVDAYNIWGVDPTHPFAANPKGDFRQAEYTPRSAYQDKYTVTLKLDMDSGPATVITSNIINIRVLNNEVWPYFGYADAVIFTTEIGFFDFNYGVFSTPQVPTLSSVYLSDALVNLKNFTDGTNRGYIRSEMLGPNGFNFEISSASNLYVSSMPEPSAVALLALGVLGIAFQRRRYTRRKNILAI